MVLICDRCGEEADTETEEGFLLCSGCGCIYNNIINEPNEKRTLKEFEKEFIIKELKGGNNNNE